MSIDPDYDCNPYDINDGAWGGPGWHGVWIQAFFLPGFLSFDPTNINMGELLYGDVIQRGGNFTTYGDKWERIWDSKLGIWRSFTPEEEARLPAHPKNDKEWMAFYGFNAKDEHE